MISSNLYIGFYGSVQAINPNDGSEIWNTKLKNKKDGFSSELVSSFNQDPEYGVNVVEHDGIVLVGSNGYIFGLDAKSGKQLWSKELKGIGANDVTLSIGNQTVETISTHEASTDNLYVGSFGFVYAISQKNGSETWRTRLKRQTYSYDSFSDFIVSLFSKNPPKKSHKMIDHVKEDVTIVEDGGIIFAGSDGYLFGLDAISGKQLWDRKLGDFYFHGDVTMSIGGKTIQTVSKPQQRARDD